jgi:SAM-dependent methyltransferase
MWQGEHRACAMRLPLLAFAADALHALNSPASNKQIESQASASRCFGILTLTLLRSKRQGVIWFEDRGVIALNRYSAFKLSRAGDVMRMTIAAVFAAALTISVSAQDFMAEPGIPTTSFPKPDRPVADIVSPIWHDEKERDNANESTQLVRLLGVKSGMTVADIGAGSGYYVVRLSPIVGPSGRIIAEDVVPKYLRGLQSRVRDLGLQNVVITLGEPHDPRLPADSLDIAILVHMYHEIAQPYGLLYNLVPALKSGARVGIVDAYGPTSEHGTPPNVLRCELAAVGYREISLDRLTGSNAYLAIFAPPSVASRTPPKAMVACKAL